MGAFYPDRVFAFVYASIYDDLFFPECLVGARIIVVNPDGTMPVIFRYSYWCVIMNEICFSIFVEEEGRIDSANFRKKDRVAPTLLRVFRFYNKIADAIYAGGNHIKSVISRIIADGWCINTSA